MSVVTGLSVSVLILSRTGWPQPGFFESTTTTPVEVMNTDVFPPPPLRTYWLSFSFVTISPSADGAGACCATAIDSVPTTSNEPRMMRRFMLCLRSGDYTGIRDPGSVGIGDQDRGSGVALLVILLVHAATEQPAADRTEPAQHVIHVAKVHQLDQVAVEILCKEKGVAARRALRLADALDPLADEEVVPSLQVADVERDVRQPDLVPADRFRRQLGTELEDLEHAAARHADPADLARRIDAGDERRHRPHAEERAHAIGRRIGDADERTAEHLPVELHRAVEVRDRDADVAEGSRVHVAYAKCVSLM